jgi:hypothetical protein
MAPPLLAVSSWPIIQWKSGPPAKKICRSEKNLQQASSRCTSQRWF